MNILHQGVGFIAGAIVTAAAMPRVMDIIRDASKAKDESYARNAMLVIGNFIWVGYGIAGDAIAISVMCTLSGLLNGAILVAAVRANRAGYDAMKDFT